MRQHRITFEKNDSIMRRDIHPFQSYKICARACEGYFEQIDYNFTPNIPTYVKGVSSSHPTNDPSQAGVSSQIFNTGPAVSESAPVQAAPGASSSSASLGIQTGLITQTQSSNPESRATRNHFCCKFQSVGGNNIATVAQKRCFLKFLKLSPSCWDRHWGLVLKWNYFEHHMIDFQKLHDGFKTYKLTTTKFTLFSSDTFIDSAVRPVSLLLPEFVAKFVTNI